MGRHLGKHAGIAELHRIGVARGLTDRVQAGAVLAIIEHLALMRVPLVGEYVVMTPLHAENEIVFHARNIGLVGECGGTAEHRAVLVLLLLVAVDRIEQQMGKVVHSTCRL